METGGDLVITNGGGDILVGDETAATGASADIQIEGKVIGRVYGRDAPHVADILTIQAEQYLENRALATDTLEKYKEITMLYDVSERILALPDAQQIAQLVCEEADRFLAGNSVSVLLVNEETERLELIASHGAAYHSRSSVEIADDLIGAVLRSGIGEIVNDVRADGRSITADNTLCSVVCSPLKTKNRVLGIVVVGSESAQHYNASDLQLLNVLASHAAAAIEVTRLHGALRRSSVKPADLLYGLNERPPLGVLGVLGLQHVCIALMTLAAPVIIAVEAGGSRLDAVSLVSMSLIAMGVATLLQSVRKGPVGSGYLVPHITLPVYLGPSLLAVQAGGLDLLFGMTLFAGVFGLMFAQLIRHFRKLFPPEVCGIVVLMSGLTMIQVALPRFLGIDDGDTVSDLEEWAVGLITIATIVVATVFALGRIRLYSTIIGIAAGYVAAFVLGIVDHAVFDEISALPTIGLPTRPSFDLAFDLSLAIPFAAAVVASNLKAVGLITTSQKANATDWKRPDMDSVGGGIVADSIGNLTSGVLGGVATGTSAGSVGLAMATGATSRIIAVAIAAIFFSLVFFPKATAGLTLMPSPVMGAGLIYVACFLVTSGVQLIMSRLMDSRRTFIVGLSVLAGIGADVMPSAFQGAPDWAMVFLGNPLALSTTLAVGLNMALNLGVSKSACLSLAAGEPVHDKVFRFFERHGAAWGARPEVIRRATPAVIEWIEELHHLTGSGEAETAIDIHFDEYRLTVDLSWKALIEGDEQRLQDFELDPIAGHIQRHYDCRLRLTGDAAIGQLHLNFEH
jgi:NCS2 family nucleobase:cation symporter-2